MAAFQFPDPTVTQTVVNPITGSTYQWKEPPGKWVVTTKLRGVSDIIYEGDNPPEPIGDYKLWYSTDTLELYFHYCDANAVCAWVPTSAPITMLEDLDEGLSEVKLGLVAANVAINENTNRIESFIYFGEEAPAIYPDVDTGGRVPDGTDEGAPVFEQDERNYKLWLNTTTDKLSVLRTDEAADAGYSYQEIDTDNNVTLQEVLDNGNFADKGFVLTNLEDDAILVSPEDARIMVGGVGENIIPKIELRHQTGILDTSIVALELDEDGSRFDIECDEKVDNIHFRFNEDVKLELNKDGAAVFKGGVEVKGSLKSNGLTNQGNATFKFGSGQGLLLDSGSSYEPMLALKSYSGPNQRKDVLIVRANGEAELLGKLKLTPGEAENEAVTYGQLATVAEEIEQVIPAYERGKYNFSLTDVSTGSSDRGKYTLLRLNTASDNSAATRECEDARNTCNRIPDKDPIDCEIEFSSCIARLPAPGTIDIVTNSFNSVQKIKFSKYDADGAKHEWTDVAVGQVIDIFNDNDDSYFVGEITAIDNGTSLVTLDVTKVQAKGNAVGAARIKVFTLNNEIDELTNYVRKTGDQMTGTLETTGRILIRPDDVGSKGGNNMLVVNQQSSKGQASIVRIQQDGDDIIKVQFDKTTSFRNNRITEVGNPTDGKDAVNMEWVQNYIGGNVRRLWKWTGDQSSSPGAGKFSFAQSGAGYVYFDHRPTVGTELFNDANQYIAKGGDSLDQDKEFGYAMFSIWEWTGTQWLPCKNGHVSSTGIRTGKNNEAWRFSSNKNTIINHRNLTTDGLYTICVSGTILS